ncbi:Protein of unknown function [Nonomuraea maritima]|uniref:DUF2530 domain-containing protein n=1 Tax=Nonomuraea maritima TaxID=683260 RepID=A0A1G9I4D9_9ACTN|nr:DUF2530 domain-containing protein [Nonomuraea maritima]SDL19683.1 Protein of unknown function [Nonomuraea maritima]
MKQQWHPDPEPIKTNDLAAVATGTAIWAVALVILLIFRPGHTWWIWTCVTGIAFGFLGMWLVRRPRT